jgi:hypothetical protein
MSSNASPIHREDAAWLAGLIDGEGCMDAPRNNARLRIKMGDLDIILRAADIMDATTYMEYATNPRHKDMMVAQVTGDRAVAVMRAILPWLGSRRSAKATEIITSHAAKKAGRIRLVRVQRAA